MAGAATTHAAVNSKQDHLRSSFHTTNGKQLHAWPRDSKMYTVAEKVVTSTRAEAATAHSSPESEQVPERTSGIVTPFDMCIHSGQCLATELRGDLGLNSVLQRHHGQQA